MGLMVQELIQFLTSSKLLRRLLCGILVLTAILVLEVEILSLRATNSDTISNVESEERLGLPNKIPKEKEARLIDLVAQSHPNVPFKFLDEQREQNWKKRKNKFCPRFPNLYELKIENELWQEFETSNGTFHLFRAYVDRRKLEVRGRVVRVLAMVDRVDPSVDIFCQFWYEHTHDPTLAKVEERKWIWVRGWGNYRQGALQPFLLTCRLPIETPDHIPVFVSLAERPCDKAYNALKLYNREEIATKKGQLAVCVKGLDFPTDDLTIRLIEWLEVLRALGAEKVFLYELSVHPNVQRALKYYAEDGFVDLTRLQLPGSQPNSGLLRHLYFKHKVTNKRQNELIPYNDCLYRNIDRFDHVALLDIDEVVVPLLHDSYAGLIRSVNRSRVLSGSSPKSSLCFRNVYFMDDMQSSALAADVLTSASASSRI